MAADPARAAAAAVVKPRARQALCRTEAPAASCIGSAPSCPSAQGGDGSGGGADGGDDGDGSGDGDDGDRGGVDGGDDGCTGSTATRLSTASKGVGTGDDGGTGSTASTPVGTGIGRSDGGGVDSSGGKASSVAGAPQGATPAGPVTISSDVSVSAAPFPRRISARTRRPADLEPVPCR